MAQYKSEPVEQFSSTVETVIEKRWKKLKYGNN